MDVECCLRHKGILPLPTTPQDKKCKRLFIDGNHIISIHGLEIRSDQQISVEVSSP